MISRLLFKCLSLCHILILFVLLFNSVTMAGEAWFVGTSKALDSAGSGNPYPPDTTVLGIMEPGSKDCQLNHMLWQDKQKNEACKNLNVAVTTLDGTAPSGTNIPLATYLCKDKLLAQAKAKLEKLKCAALQ